MVENEVLRPVKLSRVPKRAEVFTTTWACKLKYNGVKRDTPNGRGYEKVDRVHYYGVSIHAPATNGNSLHIVMVIEIMAGWSGIIKDVKRKFLKGNLDQ